MQRLNKTGNCWINIWKTANLTGNDAEGASETTRASADTPRRNATFDDAAAFPLQQPLIATPPN
jgi:hypothetical protein